MSPVTLTCVTLLVCHTQSGLARNQALITAMLSKTDDKYKAAEGEHVSMSHDCHMTSRGPSCSPARNKPQPAPVSSVLASLESDEFVPQSFVSHRTRADSDEVGRSAVQENFT